jgi:ubiquinone biosynthesis protein Coq4
MPLSRQHQFAYEEQESQQTLREALDEYYASDPSLLAPADVSDEIAQGLRAHDAAHVVFGCDTTIRGEIVLTRWSFFGAQDALPIYLRGLRSSETRFLFVEFFRKVRPVPLLLGAWDGLRALVRSFFMRARWPSFSWEQYADRPLAEIRRDYGIRVV